MLRGKENISNLNQSVRVDSSAKTNINTLPTLNMYVLKFNSQIYWNSDDSDGWF